MSYILLSIQKPRPDWANSIEGVENWHMEGRDVVAIMVMVGKFSEVATEMLMGIKNT